MSIDYAFVEKMLTKYSKHLIAIENNLEEYIENNQRQIASMEKLDQKKYGQHKKELQFKLAEALEKLSHVAPNKAKIFEQIEEIQKQYITV